MVDAISVNSRLASTTPPENFAGVVISPSSLVLDSLIRSSIVLALTISFQIEFPVAAAFVGLPSAMESFAVFDFAIDANEG